MKADSPTKLAEILERHGERVSQDATLCRALLGDYPTVFARREIHALVGAVKLGIPRRLQALDRAFPWPAFRDDLTARLSDELGLADDLAQWGVEVWAQAFKITIPTQPHAPVVRTVAGGDFDLPGSKLIEDVEVEVDPLYEQAVSVVVQNRRASISLVQLHLRIGYNRAARLLVSMEMAGVVSAMNRSGNREILAP